MGGMKQEKSSCSLCTEPTDSNEYLVPEKNISYGTWIYPAAKQFHMFDPLVMRAKQRVCCGDMQAMRRANSWTDHKLVGAKL